VVEFVFDATPLPTGQWEKVTKANPCGICHKGDWCTIGEKGRCCMRAESDRPMSNGGWFHKFDVDAPAYVHRPTPPKRVEPTEDFAKMMNNWRASASEKKLEGMAESLGVTTHALWLLGATWCEEKKLMAFPMYDERSWGIDQVCGIRLRTMDGKKFAVTGSKSGVFFPFRAQLLIDAKRLFICEGPTDTAALLSLGLFAIGRASCRGGVPIIQAIVDQLAQEVVMVCDNDGPGLEGANELIKSINRPVVKLIPPTKDIRAFVQKGATKALIESMIKDTLWKRGNQSFKK
jgi:hypothetical protein